jgi:anti-sigma factor RsiW
VKPRQPRAHDTHETTCRDAVSLVTAYLDGGLDRAQHERFERHLHECPHCLEHLKQIEATILVSGQVRAEGLDPQARADLLDLYRTWRDADDG